jgi:hypothetical protein
MILSVGWSECLGQVNACQCATTISPFFLDVTSHTHTHTHTHTYTHTHASSLFEDEHAAYFRRPSLAPFVSSTCRGSKLIHSDAVSERVLTALVNRGVCRLLDVPKGARKYANKNIKVSFEHHLHASSQFIVQLTFLTSRNGKHDMVMWQMKRKLIHTSVTVVRICTQPIPVTQQLSGYMKPASIYVRFDHDVATVRPQLQQHRQVPGTYAL